MKSYKIYRAGRFIETGTPLEVVNPYTAEVFSRTWLAGPDELETAIQGGKEAEEEMKELQ